MRHGSALRCGRLAAIVLGSMVLASCAPADNGRPVIVPTPVPSLPPAPWFAGYVDVTVPSSYRIDEPPVPEAANAVLSFIVAGGRDACTPTWGDYYSLDQARTRVDLDGRIARVREGGGEIVVSFGGALGDELATACGDAAGLADAYGSVIDRYGLDTIDLDIEGDELEDPAAGARRAAAIAGLQSERPAGDPLHVWLTLPAEPSGLTSEAVPEVARMLAAGVELAGVNIMAMNYGDSRPEGMSLLEASMEAAEATHAQLAGLYAKAGMSLDDRAIWSRMGLTPMIGHNDLAGEVTDLATARGLNGFAREHGIARLSMWSLNRDRSCGREVEQPSDTCSGVDQEEGEFSRTLGAGFTGPIR